MIDPGYRTGWEIPVCLRYPISREYNMMFRAANMVEDHEPTSPSVRSTCFYLAAYREQMRWLRL